MLSGRGPCYAGPMVIRHEDLIADALAFLEREEREKFAAEQGLSPEELDEIIAAITQQQEPRG